MWSLLKDTAANWSKHKAARLGAALAYYSIFSLGPLLVIAVAVAGFTFEQEAVRGEVSAELRALLGDTGAQAVNAMLLGASQPREGILATVFGVGTLVLAALGLVVQLKDALNTVGEVEPPRRSGIWVFVRTYIVSLAAVLSLGFLLLVSLEQGSPSRGTGVGRRAEFRGCVVVGCSCAAVDGPAFFVCVSGAAAGFFLRRHEVFEGFGEVIFFECEGGFPILVYLLG